MKNYTAKRFGEYIKDLRQKRRLGMRELARKAGVDDGQLTRLEQGKIRSPRPSTLTALATALEVPLADMFAMVGYATPYDLPSVSTYLRARYGELPEEALASMDSYCRRLIEEYGLEPDGPVGREDEQPLGQPHNTSQPPERQ